MLSRLSFSLWHSVFALCNFLNKIITRRTTEKTRSATEKKYRLIYDIDL